MNLIDKQNKKYLLGFEGNQSTKDPAFWAIIPEGVSVDIPEKYISHINYQAEKQEFITATGEKSGRFYDVVSEIIEMTPEEKAVVDAQEAYELRKENDFKGCRIRIFGDSKKARNELTGFITQAQVQGLKLWSKQDVTINGNSKIKNITYITYIGIDYILEADLSDLEQIQGVAIETLDNDDIRTKIDGVNKYTIPQEIQ